MMGGSGGGLFGYYNDYLNYKNTKAREHANRIGLESGLNQANNNLQITQEQAPLVPQQSMEDYAARGVAQSTFGAGMGNQWGQNTPGSPGNPTQQYANASTGAPSNPQGGAPGTSNATFRPAVNVTPPPSSGADNAGNTQPIGTGLQRARDLSGAMISNATSSQKAAQDALDQYNKEIVNNRRLYYSKVAQDYIGFIAGMML